MRPIVMHWVMFSATLFAPALRAQQVDAFVGVGTAQAPSNGRQIETFSDGTLYDTPKLGGVFTEFGVGVFLNRQFGVGWTASLRSAHDYAGLQYRPSFNTFDAVFQPAPLRTKRAVPELRAGIGLTSVHIDSPDQPSCDQVPGCPVSRHFQAHIGGAARLYLTDHIFLRPAIDFHHVNNFFLFGSDWVHRYSMSFGYSFGRK